VGVLARIAAAALIAASVAASGACYSPSIESCTLPCAEPTDCPSEFACLDGVCVAGEDTCPSTTPDAAPLPDASGPTASLEVKLDGRGLVIVSPDDRLCRPPATSCLYEFELGTMVKLEARAIQVRRQFVGWTTDNCKDAGAVCLLTLTEPTTVATAKFKD
jgi:hypothetical protein